MTATAPGKLILAGEYAVLTGGVAVVTAVGRHVRARLGDDDAPPTPLLAALAEVLRAHGEPTAAARARRIVVDASALIGCAGKLGLGSSAAVVVAATALALGDDADRGRIQRIAAAAHATDQRRRGAAGSGADVAAATWGGTLAFRTGVHAPHTLAVGVRWIPYFTGTPADTAALVARVEAGSRATPVAATAATAAIAAAAERLLRATDATTTIAAIDAGADALDALATACRVPLVPPGLAAVRAAARACGGAAKTTGAGGGDVVIVALPAGADPAPLHAAIEASGGTVLLLDLAVAGVTIDRAG